MAKKTDIFGAGNISTAALPLPMFDRLLETDGVHCSTILLYVYLVRRATGPTFRLHTGNILADTGLSRQTFLTAREALRSAGLLLYRETRKQGMWTYELLGTDGGALPMHSDRVRFADLSPEDIEAFFANRLGVSGVPARTPDGHPVFDCPFHVSKSERQQRTLRVTTDAGSENNGRYICNHRKCKRTGGLIQFEMEMAAKQGNPRDFAQSTRAVNRFFMSRRPSRQDADLLAPEGPHPTLAELTEDEENVTF